MRIIESKGDAEVLKDAIQETLSWLPWTSIHASSLGGEARSSVLVTGVLIPEAEWPNGIRHNAPYATLHVMYDGTIEFASGYKLAKKFRKTKAKSFDEVCAKLDKYFHEVMR